MVSFSGGAIFVAAVLAAVCIVPIVRLAAAVVCLASRKKDALRYGRAARGFYYHNGARRAFKGVREEDDVFHDDTAFVRCDRLAVILFAPLAWTQESPPVRVRGTVERVEGQAIVIKARDGAELKVVLADNAMVVGIVKASMSDIKQGSFVGVTGMPQPDGS